MTNGLKSAGLVVLLFAGCEATVAEISVVDGDTGNVDSVGILPLEGPWVAFNANYLENTCALPAIPDGMTVISDLVLHDDESLGVEVAATQTGNFDCSLENGTFECGTNTLFSDYRDQGVDLFLTVSETLRGSFASESYGTFEFMREWTCEGTECASVEEQAAMSLDCISSGTGSIAYKSN